MIRVLLVEDERYVAESIVALLRCWRDQAAGHRESTRSIRNSSGGFARQAW